MKREIGSLRIVLSVVIMLMVMLGMGVSVYADSHTHNISGQEIEFTAWTDELAKKQHNDDNCTAGNSMPATAGDYFLTEDVTISEHWYVPAGKTRLCLNGYGIRYAADWGNEVISTYDGALDVLYDCGNRDHYITLENWRGISVSDSGTAVTVDADGNGVVKVSGGYITGGYLGSSQGGCIVVTRTLNMYGGTIIGNSAYRGAAMTAYTYYGTNGEINMYGGSIIYNMAGDSGGAINLVNGGTFNMYGGSITKNRAKKDGGAINLASGGIASITGGTITDNTAESGNGGAIWVSNSTDTAISVSGSPEITGNKAGDRDENVYLNSTRITVTGKLDEKAAIGVTKGNGEGIFAVPGTPAGGGTEYTITTTENGDIARFSSDDQNSGVVPDTENNKTVLRLVKQYKLVYDPNGGKGSIDPVTVHINDIVKLPECSFIPPKGTATEGYRFDHWDISGVDGLFYPDDDYTVAENSVLDGVITVKAIWRLATRAIITESPSAKDQRYTAEDQLLVNPGQAEHGKMVYAIGRDAANALDSGWTETIPKKKAAGIYYVWYKAAAASPEYSDSEPGCCTAEIKKDMPDLTVVPGAITYGQSLADSKLSDSKAFNSITKAEVAGTFAWADDKIIPSVSDSDKTEYSVIFTPDDKENYNMASAKVKLTVDKADQPAPDAPAKAAATLSSITLTAVDNCEYSMDAESWQDDTEFTGLSPDTEYKFWQRFKGDVNHNASKPSAAAVFRTDKEPMPEVVSVFPKAMAAKGKTSLVVRWRKVSGADGYDIFLTKCSSKAKLKKIKTIKGNKKTSWTKKKLKAAKPYKACVKAWVSEDGNKKYISESPDLYAYTTNGTKKYTNPKSVKVKKSKVSIKTGKTYKIKATVKKVDKKKKLMPAKYTAKLRYMSSNTEIATVSRKGVIKAKKSGTCKVCVYAANGVNKTIKVTVK